MNIKAWLRLNYELTYMDDENGALGVRRKATAASAAFGGGNVADMPYERLSVAVVRVLAHMRADKVPGGKNDLVEALHALGIDQQTKALEDRRINRREAH